MRIDTLNKFEQKNGFSIVELLIVTSIAAILLAASSSYFSSNVALRRSVDDLTANIATTLQLAKLQAGRSGVEFRAVFATCDTPGGDDECLTCSNYTDFAEGDEVINIIVERGDSNRGSTNWCIQSEQAKEFQSDLDFLDSDNMSEDPLAVSFLPTGLRGDFRDDQAVEVLSLVPIDGAPVDKCGVVQVTAMGGITVIHGRWDGTDCNPILDAPPTPGPS